MEKQDFKISSTLVWLLVIGYFIFTGFGALFKIMHWEYSFFLLMMGLMFLFSIWVIVLSDMFNNKIYNKAFWIISMFIIPIIASVFYLIQRKRLLRLGEKFS